MKVSKAVRVGLSGTSLALAALASVGCASEDVATKEQLKPRAHYVEQAIDQAAADQEREARRYDEEARQVALQSEGQNNPQSPWFLRPGGAVDRTGETPSNRPASTEAQPNNGVSDPPAIVIHEPPKPVKPVVAQQPQQPIRPNGWQVRAACGRG